MAARASSGGSRRADGDATALRPFDDDLILVNLAVWESLESLRAFVYDSAHVDVLRQRRDWFERLATAHMVLWWVEPGHIPTVEEAIDRLERLRRDGPTPAAFTFRTPFEPRRPGPGAPLVDAEFCWPEQAARLVMSPGAARRRLTLRT